MKDLITCLSNLALPPIHLTSQAIVHGRLFRQVNTSVHPSYRYGSGHVISRTFVLQNISTSSRRVSTESLLHALLAINISPFLSRPRADHDADCDCASHIISIVDGSSCRHARYTLHAEIPFTVCKHASTRTSSLASGHHNVCGSFTVALTRERRASTCRYHVCNLVAKFPVAAPDPAAPGKAMLRVLEGDQVIHTRISSLPPSSACWWMKHVSSSRVNGLLHGGAEVNGTARCSYAE